MLALLALSALAYDTQSVTAGRGPVPLIVPDAAGPGNPVPLVVLLHGYGGTGPGQEAYMNFTPHVDSLGFALTYPTGNTDILGIPFWNATDYCCGFFSNPDDVGYLTALVDAVEAQIAVDPQRIYLVGHSNGGFMSYRMACEDSGRFAAIASLAGATFDDPLDCTPTSPVHVLQIHGTNDNTILFDGDCGIGSCYPSAIETATHWHGYNSCVGGPATGPSLDLDLVLPGADTDTYRVGTCDPGGSVGLWVMPNGEHVPALNGNFAPYVVQYLLAHPKP